MRVYSIPYNFEHEEKVFGGYVSLRQAIYLIFSVCMIGIYFLTTINIYIKIILFLVFIGILLLFAFAKIDGTNADKYFLYFFKYILRRKTFILER